MRNKKRWGPPYFPGSNPWTTAQFLDVTSHAALRYRRCQSSGPTCHCAGPTLNQPFHSLLPSEGFHLPWTLLETTSLAPGASRTNPLLDWRQAGGGAVGPTSIQQWIRTQGSHHPDITDPCERDGSSQPLGGQSPPLAGYITAGICSGGWSPKPWIVFTQPPVYRSPECQNNYA